MMPFKITIDVISQINGLNKIQEKATHHERKSEENFNCRNRAQKTLDTKMIIKIYFLK